MTDVLSYDVADRVAVLTMNRPEARNALDNALREAIAAGMERADDDPAVDVVILTGADPAFCAGMDLKQVERDGLPDRVFTGPGAWWGRIGKPVIGAVNGVAVTGGLELALACDFLIGSDRARFGDTHARVGVLPGGGLTAVLPRIVGLRRAKQMSFTGNFLSAQEAFALGLITHLVPHAELMPTARAIAADIVGNDQEAVRALKQMYDDVAAVPLAEGFAVESQIARAWKATHDHGRGVSGRREAIMARGRTQTG